MTANPPDGGTEPADLSQVSGTDAMLDRLGARRATAEDLSDPAAAVLAELVTVIDTYREPDLGLGRLVEVLAGRPLYVSASDETLEHVGSNRTDQDGVGSGSRVIDLTDHGRTHGAGQGDGAGSDGAGLDGAGLDGEGQREGDGVVALIPAQSTGRSWDRVVGQIALPAAAVVLLLALGGGVSAAVTGDPMTPLNGVSRVMAQFPGVGGSNNSVSDVKGEIKAASTAAQQHDAPSAHLHLAAAKAALSDVPDDTKPQLRRLIANVEITLTVPPSTAPAGPAAVGPTKAPVSEAPVATAEPTETEAPPAVSDPTPTEVTVPSSAPVTTDPDDASPQPADPTPEATDTGP